MIDRNIRKAVAAFGLAALTFGFPGFGAAAFAQTPAPSTAQAPAKPAAQAPTPAPTTSAPTAPVATPAAPASTPPAAPAPATAPAAGAATPDNGSLGTSISPPTSTQIENNVAPGIPNDATTENVDVPAHPVAMLSGQSSYEDAFKSIKAALDTVKAAVVKAGLTQSGHPITIFSEPDDKGFKFQAAVPLSAKPEGKDDLGDGVKIGLSPAGKSIKFQHRGAYDDIDSTYDVITTFLDTKGLQVGNPYIEEYLTDLKTADDPNLQVDIYVFVK